MPRGASPGERRGGRLIGSRNKKRAEFIAKIEASGVTPLEYMLSVLRDESNDKLVRMTAAKDAAPYVHARLNAIDHSGELRTRDISDTPLSEAEWADQHVTEH